MQSVSHSHTRSSFSPSSLTQSSIPLHSSHHSRHPVAPSVSGSRVVSNELQLLCWHLLFITSKAHKPALLSLSRPIPSNLPFVLHQSVSLNHSLTSPRVIATRLSPGSNKNSFTTAAEQSKVRLITGNHSLSIPKPEGRGVDQQARLVLFMPKPSRAEQSRAEQTQQRRISGGVKASRRTNLSDRTKDNTTQHNIR